MGADQHQDWAALAASALEWWRDAGVDTLVGDEPHDWLAAPEAPAAAPIDAPPQPLALPDTLEAFVAWRIGEDAPEAGASAPLRGAEGDPAADLMVVVDCPGDEGLVDGDAGRLLDRMLAAIGHRRETIYLASLCAARPLGGRIAPETEERLATLLRRHVALAAPKVVLTLGQAPSRALLGMDGAAAVGSLQTINLDGVTVGVVASLHPRLLLERPMLKGEAWKDLQVLMGGLR